MSDPIEFTASEPYYRVYVNDIEVSKHFTEREALQRASREVLYSPDAAVHFTHKYRVDVKTTRREILKVAVAAGAAAVIPDAEPAVITVAASPPEMPGDATYTGDFESGTLGQPASGASGLPGAFIFTDATRRTLFDDTRAQTGSQSAKTDGIEGTTAYGWSSLDLTPNPVGGEIWWRMAFWIPASFDFTAPGAASSAAKWMAFAPDTGTSRVYASRSNTKVVFASEPDPGNQLSFTDSHPRDQWVTMEYYIKIATSDTDGRMRLWRDGVLVKSHNIGTIANAAYKIDEIRLSGYWNGGVPQDQSFWQDNIVIYNSADGDTPSNTDSEGNTYIGI